MVTLTVSAQTTSTYGDLRAKLLHVGQQFTGRNTVNDQAIAVVLRELANNYQGHLSRQQFRELRDTIEGMRSRISAETWRTALSNAVKTLQEKTDTLDIQQCILDYYKRVPQEQIYVHTDKPYYVPGDTVWFRAHLVDAVTHTPISRSRYVYVELHDQQADTLMQRIIVKCDSDGVFANAILLPKTMKGGSYTLAAYTQWMRNFPAERFFYKELLVVGNTSLPSTESDPYGLRVRSLRTQSPLPSDSGLELGQRKGQLLIQLNKVTDAPLACVLYGSGNLLVADYTQGKVLRIDSQTLRPGNVSIAMVHRETGDIVAESQTTIEGGEPQVNISGNARTHNDPMELDITLMGADGTPLSGNFSLSVTDYDVVTPDTIQPTIDKYLDQQSADYPLADMLNGTYPRIDYSFQTSQTISGQIRGTFFKKVKHPKLMLFRPDKGLRQTFELGDSSRFTVNGLDFPDGTTYVLEGLRRTGSTSLVQLNIDPQTFPTLHAPFASTPLRLSVPDNFAKQAQKQVMYGSIDREIELPEIEKVGRKTKPQKQNFLNIEAPRGLPEGDPRIDRAVTMQQLLLSLGMRVTYYDGVPFITTPDNAGVLIYIDNIREEDHDYVLNLVPSDVKSIEYFTPNNAVNGFFAARPASYSGKVPGVLFIFFKDGSEIVRARSKDRLSMVTVHQSGYSLPAEFYSPQYPDPSAKTRPDHRTTLYWNPKVETDEKGHASVRFYASDISKRYLVTLEGVSDDGTIVYQQRVIE